MVNVYLPDGLCIFRSRCWACASALWHSSCSHFLFSKVLLLELISITFKHSAPSLHSWLATKLTQPSARRRGPSSLHTLLNYFASVIFSVFFLVFVCFGQCGRLGSHFFKPTTHKQSKHPLTLQPESLFTQVMIKFTVTSSGSSLTYHCFHCLRWTLWTCLFKTHQDTEGIKLSEGLLPFSYFLL